MSDESHLAAGCTRAAKHCDLTQEALGERVGCAVDTIRRYEAGRLRPSREVAARLAEQLALGPAEAERFVQAARRVRVATPAAAPARTPAPVAPQPAHPPDAADRARARDGAACAPAAARRRAPADADRAGGTGKTRLALQVAADLRERFPTGVYFVDLAPISDPALVLPTIAQTLGLADEGTAWQPAPARAARAYLRDSSCCCCWTTSSRCWTPPRWSPSCLRGARG